MTAISEASVLAALRTVQEPELGGDLVTRNMIKDLVVTGSDVAFTIELTTPACPLKDQIETEVRSALVPGRRRGSDHRVGRHGPSGDAAVGGAAGARGQERDRRRVRQGRRGQEHRRASTWPSRWPRRAPRWACSTRDITGPNIPMMLGIEGQPVASPNNKIVPLERHGVKAISIQFFVPEGQPIVWRGPLIGGAIRQFLRDVEWGELDYLVVDLPPGTSDAQLTLAQAVPISGAVLVTTPQDVALSDVAKALAMLERLNVPIIGLVENMSAFVCPHCGEATEIFGRGGGERFAEQHGIDVPGQGSAGRHGAPGRRCRHPGRRPA